MIDMFYHMAVYNLTSYHMAFDRHSLPYGYGPIITWHDHVGLMSQEPPE